MVQTIPSWKERGAKDRAYAILTDEIYKSTFNVNTVQYKELSRLENLDDLIKVQLMMQKESNILDGKIEKIEDEVFEMDIEIAI